jgi:Mce-associated membrane protein
MSIEELVTGQTDRDELALPRKDWTLLLIVGLLVAGVAAAGLFGVLAAKESGKADDRRDALAAATERVPVLLTYSFRTLKDDLARSKDQTVGTFQADYSQLLDDVVTRAATEKKISTQAALTGAGVVDAEGDKVTVLAFLTQTTTAPGSAPSVNTSRVEVTMQHVGDTWKIAGLTPR